MMNFIIKFSLSFVLFTHLAALDTSKDVIGKDCTVTEPMRNFTFDLSSLKNDLGRNFAGENNEKFLFNICGTLGRKCNNQTASACMIDSVTKKETVIGFSEHQLIWNEGSLRFQYTGEKCNGTRNYKMNLMLHCDYFENVHDRNGAFLNSDTCEVYIVFHTKKACLPKTDNYLKTKCYVNTSTGDILNFSPLRNANHRTQNGPGGTYFMIGVCDPVLYEYESACEAGTSVCQIDESKTGVAKYRNVGSMTQDFELDNGHVTLTLTSKEICKGNMTYKSHIIFSCDNTAGYSSIPEYMHTIDCTHFFLWSTSAACIEKKSCQIFNPDTGVTHDFHSLSGIQLEAVNKNNSDEKILFSVCSEAKEPCMKNSGSCIVKLKNNQSTQAGIVNDELKLDGKNPYLHYENGAICEKLGQHYNTRIDFICADNLEDEGAVAIENGCNITIHYKTLLACDYIKNCVAKRYNGEEFDLSPLIDYEGNYVAKVNGKNLPEEASDDVRYVMNICRPLNSIYSLNCRGSSGACRTVLDKNGKHENEISLGHIDYVMTATRDDKVVMKYLDGATCPTDPSENTTTKITFFCDEKAGYGNPILQSIDNCEYAFDFATNIICREQVLTMGSDCSLVNNKTSVSVDLKLFGQNGVYVTDGKKINICGSGDNTLYSIVYSQSLVRLEFPIKNGNDKIDVEVQLKCSKTSNSSTTFENDNRILVRHVSSIICPLFKIETVNPAENHTSTDDKPTPTTSGFTLGYVVLIGIVIVSFIAIFLVVRNPERREIIRNLIKFRSPHSRVQYSRVRLGERSQLLDNRTAGLLSDESSDDENILL